MVACRDNVDRNLISILVTRLKRVKMRQWLLIVYFISTSAGQLQDHFDLDRQTDGVLTDSIEYLFHTYKQAAKNGVNIIDALVWQAREALISSTLFKDRNCITVGFNLKQNDLIFFEDAPKSFC